ncbi:hypothetical protein UFOVP73_43 [uncultured Caudovirales phage]|uniref:Uncharacterized protein n=1 Tax=uncultured Caudovirales phage TaxID=2100421 RepID=A0A6J5KUA1_9CAUD|nr:hypothetical protein UFOVP73_43 [uncultured Caudovirales phage]CAB5194502.1 hypothetical protein UFOVP170_3 [uncultured Caudovirales phage]
MATGNIKWFQQGVLDLGNKIHNLSSDALLLGIVTTATVPSMATAGPHWGGTGTTNFATNQVGTGGGYTGPITLASVTWTNVSGVLTLKATDVVIPQNASGFSTGAYGIIYNNTDANKRAIAFIELSSAGTLSIVSGSVTIDFQGSGTDVLTITPA